MSQRKRHIEPLGELNLDITPTSEHSFHQHHGMPFDDDELEKILAEPTSESHFAAALDDFIIATQIAVQEAIEQPGHEIEPRNAFESVLYEAGMKICETISDDGNRKLVTFIEGDLNHVKFAKRLQELFQDNEQMKTGVIRALEKALNDDELAILYFSPSKSARYGTQDTAYKAMLLISATQASVFDLLIQRIQHYAYSAPATRPNAELAALSVNHVRFIDEIFDSRRMFEAVFRYEIELWRPPTRDILVQAIPEVVLETDVIQDAVINLREMFLKDVVQNGVELRLAILQALSLMRIPDDANKGTRAAFLRRLNKVQATVLPDLVYFCLKSVDRSNHKGQFKLVLTSLAENLDLSRLLLINNTADADCKKRTDIGPFQTAPIVRIFASISAAIHAGGVEALKAVMSLLAAGKAENSLDDEEDNADEQEGNADREAVAAPRRSRKPFDLFELMLIISLLDGNDDEEFTSLIAVVKRQMLIKNGQCGNPMTTIFVSLVRYQAFCQRYIRQIVALCQRLVWTGNEIVARFAGDFYMKLFLSSEFRYQQEVVLALIRHANSSDFEATVGLSILQELAETNVQALLEHSTFLGNLFDTVYQLQMSNVRRLFQILVRLYTYNTDEGDNSEVDFMISIGKYLSSGKQRETIWGVIGILIHMKEQLGVKRLNEAETERLIADIRSRLDAQPGHQHSAMIRTVLYRELANILNSCKSTSRSLMSWCEELLIKFRKDFFGPAAGDDANGVPLKIDFAILCSGNEHATVQELTPFFYLMVVFVRCRYAQLTGSNSKKHEELLELQFALDAEILVKEDDRVCTVAECDSVFNAIKWIRTLLDVFAHCEPDDDAQRSTLDEALKKKLEQMCQYQRRLLKSIRLMDKYRMPEPFRVDASEGSIPIVFYGQAAIKPTADNGKTQKKGNGGDEDRPVPADNDANEEEPLEPDDPDEPGPSKPKKPRKSSEKTKKKKKTDKKKKAEPKKKEKKRKSDSTEHVVDCDRLLEYFAPLQLVTHCRLVQLFDTSKHLIFIMEEMVKAMKAVLPYSTIKTTPWMMHRNSTDKDTVPLFPTVLCEQSEAQQRQNIWRCLLQSIESILTNINQSFLFFGTPDETADESARSPSLTATEKKRMNVSVLFNAGLRVIASILSSDEVGRVEGTDPDDSEFAGSARNSKRKVAYRAKAERRRKLMEAMEHAIIKVTSENDQQHRIEQAEEAEMTVFRYFLKVAESIPTAPCAIGLLEVFVSFDVAHDGERRQAAKHGYEFLKRDWWNIEDNKKLIGTRLTPVVKSLLKNYIALRSPDIRLKAILWLIANPLAALMPETNRRDSKEYCELQKLPKAVDPMLTNEPDDVKLACFDVSTFSTTYGSLFKALNEAIGQCGGNRPAEEIFAQWKTASSIFCLLMLMIRAKKLRSHAVLVAAVREGRRFLLQFCKDFLRRSELKRFAEHSKLALGVVLNVRDGNRKLQDIVNAAKIDESALLVRMTPELRAAGELFMRNIYTILASNQLEGFYEIEVRKLRDLDGNVIVKAAQEDLNEADNSTGADDREEVQVDEVKPNDEEEEGGNDEAVLDESDEEGSLMQGNDDDEEQEEEDSPNSGNESDSY